MSPTITAEIPRLASATLDRLASVSAAVAHEAMDQTGAMEPPMALRTAGGPICGQAITVSLPPGDNLMIHVGTEFAEPGDVLVIEARSQTAATWGELATKNAMRRGVAGVVTGGNVRDVAEISAADFPVFAPAVSHHGGAKDELGSVNVPVVVGGVSVDPGDVVVGDADGVTVVPHERASEVADAAESKRQREREIDDAIESGTPLLEAADLTETVERLAAEADVDLPSRLAGE
ncbi:4-carboxy-4-hydroxy-2-oxoadipate aldolase/oxaloacetate decarboxylase [Halovivax limisalsi]|uniref:4-carboxy-4-hydroxy-2-oxoadipate aldolase/oxaloacetate decarboxylase n=1 Tax=Halovivax limisalsi TaxID=1453760 RepID=UPI001FFD4835|nr:4-carboxy-4-hydroxy-2-oxoadipate aldolase/oxaloacetate decarboxylase [Halovivax limisalsi]